MRELEFLATHDLEGTEGALDERKFLPFEELFCTLVSKAKRELQKRVGNALYGLLKPTAHVGWERYLLARLTSAGAKAAYWQFQVYKTVAQAFAREERNDDGKKRLYRSFIGDEPDYRLQTLFRAFPALRQLCETLIENWLSAVTEFLVRINADRQELGCRFNSAVSLGRVTSIQAGLSDPHQGGRCVTKARFENGLTLVYKPRSVKSEEHFSKLVDWVNLLDIPYSIKSARCWDRGAYGWMECINAAPCADLTNVQAFYWRAGVLLALVYFARGVDMHWENLIAAGEFPVLVDLETLWHPQEHVGNHANSVAPILRTGFLPQYNSGGQGTFKLSALSIAPQVEFTGPRWIDVNEDNMAWKVQTLHLGHLDHLPTLQGQVHPAPDFANDVRAGFEWVGNRLLHCATERETLTLWLKDLQKCPRRRLLRSSVWYQTIRERLTLPASLTGSELPEWRIDVAFCSMEETVEEGRALRQMDIPYFVQDAQTSHGPLEGTLCLPSEEEFNVQLQTIVASLSRVNSCSV